MELRLLGPVELSVGGAAKPLPGRGERALLAVLALSAGRVVASSALIDALWGEQDLPEDPSNALQLRVSKLRRALSSIGARDVVLRDGAGYRLALEPSAVDVHRFTGLVDAARRTGAAAEGAELYARALDLWRGEPLVDFAGEAWTVVESGRLTELRLSALAERAERLLTLGDYTAVVAELEPVVTVLPTRERLVAQLMTALFNVGRQAESVEIYTRTRHVLADELGLDPSRELRAVMDQILRQDPAVTATTAQAQIPRQHAAVVNEAAPSTGLPLRTTSFVGRDEELARTVRLVGESRLVTLAGPGGAGKTTLGIEAARAAAPAYANGAVLVLLAAVGEGDMLVHTIADALGVSIEGGTAARHPRDLLIGHLRSREVLLVLDNCEHLLEPVASLVETLLSRCPDVRILATSREALAVPGEVQLPVVPLPVPDDATAPKDVPGYAAARLFLDRARAATPHLVIDAEALHAVGLICQRLDGIPLAIELAAARLASLSPAELAERVQDRFAVLTTGSRTADARQQTLRSAVDWSHDLLTAAERVLFRRIAVFRGGWTLAAAERVVASEELPSAAVLDLLDRLVRQSLVITDQAAGHTRYRMLETLREYAVEQLDRSDERAALSAAHAAYYLGIAEEAETGLRGHGQARWMALLRDEHPNLRAALAWLTETEGHTDEALRLAGSLGLYWHMGRHLEGRELLGRVMALSGGTPAARARAMQAVSLVERPRACIAHPSELCAAAARQSLEVFEAVGDRPRAAFSRLLLAVEGVGAHPSHDIAGLLEHAERDFQAVDDEWGQAVAAFVRLETLAKRGDEASARAAGERAIELFRSLGDGWGLSAALYHFGWALERFGQHDDAVPLLEEAIEVAMEAGVYNTVQWATADLGLTLLSLGRVDEALACFGRAGAVSDQVGDAAGRVLAMYGEAVLALQEGRHEDARPLFHSAHVDFERLGVWLATGLALAGMAACDEQAGDLGGARENNERLLKLGETAGEVGLIAAGLEGLARAALADADAVSAAELLGRAAALRQTYDRPPTALEQVAAEEAADRARRLLGRSTYEEATLRGAAMGLGVSA